MGSDRYRGNDGGCGADFNPRSPCGERPSFCLLRRLRSSISIHAPRVGSDSVALFMSYSVTNISIHAPRVGSDKGYTSVLARILISIHAPRVGSDRCLLMRIPTTQNFNPRSPCGERPRSVEFRTSRYHDFNPRSPCGERPFHFHGFLSGDGLFQSTLPVWGATEKNRY